MFKVEAEQKRYDELIAKEERLRMLENALRGYHGYPALYELKSVFGLDKEQKDV